MARIKPITTRDNLQARQTALAAELEQAVACRRELLIQGSDAAAIAEAERACREVESTAAGIADALAEVERRIDFTEAKIEEARIAGEREAAAATLERDSKAIDASAERVRQAVAALAAAQAALAGAITLTSAPHFNKHDFADRCGNEAPESLAAYFTGLQQGFDDHPHRRRIPQRPRPPRAGAGHHAHLLLHR